jgi:hypothetical protein
VSDQSVRERVEAIHDHLAATAERPVERAASAHLGEAEAVAADVALDPDASPEVIRLRLEQVRDLLAEVEGTGDEAADEHVDAARSLTESVLGDLPD